MFFPANVLDILTCTLLFPRRYPLTADQEVQMTDWENYIKQLAREITVEQTPRRFAVRVLLVMQNS